MLFIEKKSFHQLSTRFSLIFSLMLVVALSGCGGLGEDDDEEKNNANQQGVSTDLVGAWELTSNSNDFAKNINTYLVLTNTGEFFFFNHAPDPSETCRELGFEYGTYSVSGNRLTVNGSYNGDRCVGLLDTFQTSSSFTFNRESEHVLNNLQFEDEEDSSLDIEARRINVDPDSIVGAWHEPIGRTDDKAESNGKSLILLLLENNNYYVMDMDLENVSETKFAYGVYAFNPPTGDFALIDNYTNQGSPASETLSLSSVGDQMIGEGILLDRVYLGGIDPEVNNGGGDPINSVNDDCREPATSFELGITINETFDSLERFSCFWYAVSVDQGRVYELTIEDQWSDLPNGSDTVVEFYEEGSFPISSTPVIVNNDNNKVDNPIIYQARTYDTLFIKFLNDGGINPSELADMKFRLTEQ